MGWLERTQQRPTAKPRQRHSHASTVDLLKPLDMDSSLAARKQFATEPYCPDELLAPGQEQGLPQDTHWAVSPNHATAMPW